MTENRTQYWPFVIDNKHLAIEIRQHSCARITILPFHSPRLSPIDNLLQAAAASRPRRHDRRTAPACPPPGRHSIMTDGPPSDAAPHFRLLDRSAYASGRRRPAYRLSWWGNPPSTTKGAGAPDSALRSGPAYRWSTWRATDADGRASATKARGPKCCRRKRTSCRSSSGTTTSRGKDQSAAADVPG